MLKVLVAETRVTVFAAEAAETAAIGVWRCPGSTRSLWISSLTISTPRARHISASRWSVSGSHTLPTGLCGLQRTSIRVPSSMTFSRPSRSICQVPSRSTSGFSTTRRPLPFTFSANG